MRKNKEKRKKNQLFYLSARAYALFLSCLMIHILYNSLILYAIHQELIDLSFFRLQRSLFIESQILSLLFTLIGTLLFDAEVKRRNQISPK